MKKTFWQINQQVLLSEDAPMGGGMDMGGMSGGSPGGAPSMGGGPPGGGMGGPPIGGPPMGGGMGGPPIGGGMGLDAGMGGPPMGGPSAGGNPNKQIELSPLDVWEVLNKILDGKKIKVEKQKKPIQPPPNNVQSGGQPPQGVPNEAQPPGMNPPQGMPN